MTESATSDFYAVIPAGGIGSRLWPLSRADEPKFLHDLAGTGHSLLVDTWNRLEPVAGGNIVVVCGVAHKKTVKRELPDLAKANLVLEPNPKDSTAAIALAAAIIALVLLVLTIWGLFAAKRMLKRLFAPQGAS